MHKGLRLQQDKRGINGGRVDDDMVLMDRCRCLLLISILFFSIQWCGGDGEDLVAAAMEVVERQGSAMAARMSYLFSFGSPLLYIGLGGSSLAPNTAQ
jgi:hypothetical protein